MRQENFRFTAKRIVCRESDSGPPPLQKWFYTTDRKCASYEPTRFQVPDKFALLDIVMKSSAWNLCSGLTLVVRFSSS
jgi:hypothetical protein